MLKNLDSLEFPIDACDRFEQFANSRMTPANYLQNGLLVEPWVCTEDEADVVKVRAGHFRYLCSWSVRYSYVCNENIVVRCRMVTWGFEKWQGHVQCCDP